MEGEKQIIPFLKVLLERLKISSNRLAEILGVSQASVSRWLSGKDAPDIGSCEKIAEVSDESLYKILYIAGHIKKMPTAIDELPSFKEYVERKYPGVFEEDLIVPIEDYISRRKAKIKQQSIS